MDRKIVPGGLYRHYKNRWYFVLNESFDSESDNEFITYFPLYLDELRLFVRDKNMFLEYIDKENEVNQRERFLESGKIDLDLNMKKELLKKASDLLKQIGLSIREE